MPGEDSALSYFSISTSSVSSQIELQASSLDDQLFSQILNTSNIHVYSLLHGISLSSGTSIGWLKAIPQLSLGLALSSDDFVMVLRLWLSVPLFPLSPLCTCLSVINQFGDHLLGCSHGLLGIQRHGVLVTVVHHTLLQDVLR